MSRSSLLLRLPLSAAALFALVAACGDGDDGTTSAAIRSFCTRYMSASALACCSAADRQEASFGARYRFGSAAECSSVLSAQESGGAGKQTFDGAAADSCIQHLSSRDCGIVVTRDVIRAEHEAGCFSIFKGSAQEGQNCQTSDDCLPGLVCPPIKETGTAFCAKPAGPNQDCHGVQATSVNHPACVEGHICHFIGENPAGCPLPPCLIFKCVPPFDAGEPCAGTECAPGLVCKDGTCQQGAPNGVGGSCRVIEHCAPGLYCDTSAGTCAARKAAGTECRIANNALYECQGVCRAEGGAETCAAFCGQ